MVPLITDRKQASFHFAFPSPLHPLNANILYPPVLATRTHLVEIYMPIAKKETPEELPQGMHCHRNTFHSVSPEFFSTKGQEKRNRFASNFRGCDRPSDGSSGEKRVWHEPRLYSSNENEWQGELREKRYRKSYQKVILPRGGYLFPT